MIRPAIGAKQRTPSPRITSSTPAVGERGPERGHAIVCARIRERAGCGDFEKGLVRELLHLWIAVRGA